MKKIIAIALTLGVGIGGYAIGNSQENLVSDAPSSASVSASASPIPSSVELSTPPTDPQAALAWSALMDPTGEYAAFAMYTEVIEKYGDLEPYTSIRSAEQRHIDALIRQLERYGINAPTNPYLGKVTAPSDLASAAIAWASGEIENVALYDDLLSQAKDASLIKVFNNLRSASLDMHLPMFEQAALNGGQLTAEEMNNLEH